MACRKLKMHYLNSQNIIICNIKHQKCTPIPVFCPYNSDLKKTSDTKVELLHRYQVYWENKTPGRDTGFSTLGYIVLTRGL